MEEATSTPAAEAVESGAPGTTDTASVTDGGTTQATTDTATQDAGTAEQTATAASEESTEAKNERRQRQREARKQASPVPEPVKTREEIAAEIRAQDAADARAAEQQRQEAMRYARYFGDDPADPKEPSGPTRYQKALAEAALDVPDGEEQYFTDDARALLRRKKAGEAEVARFNEKRQLLHDVRSPVEHAERTLAREWLGNEIERGLSEMGLPAAEITAAAVQAAIKDPTQAIPTILKQLAAAKDAEYKPQIEDLEDELAAKDSEIDALKRQLGGAAPQALRGGVAAGVGGALTYERYVAMSPQQRMALRSTPEGRAQIDAMTQGRSGVA